MINNFNGIESTSEYLRGMRDAKAGRAADIGASDDYNHGYGTQYEAEQALTEMGLMQDRAMSLFS